MDKRYQVFISSTQRDLAEERQKVADGLLRGKYIPHMMERWVASPSDAWSTIRRYIDQCDYFVLILKGRYGSLLDDRGISFTEREYDYACERGIPVLAFLYENIGNLMVEQVDEDTARRAKMRAFRARIERERVRDTWTNPSDLAYKVSAALDAISEERPGIGWIRGDAIPDGVLSATVPILDPARLLGIRRISEDGNADRMMNNHLRTASDIRIMSTSAVRFLEIYRRDLVDAVSHGARLRVLVPQPDSAFAADVDEMESEFTKRRPIAEEIEAIPDRLFDLLAEARGIVPATAGSASIGYFTTHLRSTMIICDDDWAWMTVTLPPLRAAETMSMECARVGGDDLVWACLRHFDRVWRVVDGRGDVRDV
ncbi:DUF4062 domain-containing protein [Dactylosporangium sp. NPDC050588]|uniref:DUF4062 domain-containing protein n=1 Tax=Dactylosporangium sp. NPDC050588 TaxID=3157211 RepID=UPI0033DF3505